MKIKLTIMALLVMSASLACAFGFDFGFDFGRNQCAQEDQIPIMAVLPTSKAFGNRTTGTTISQLFSVSNTGKGTITGIQAQMSSAGPFRVYSSSGTTAPMTAKVEFAPTATGAFTNAVLFSSDQFPPVRVAVSGTGVSATISITDSFTGANQALSDYNANWVQPSYGGTSKILSNQVVQNTFPGMAYRSDWANGANQCAEIKALDSRGSTSGPVVRMSDSAAATFYLLNMETGALVRYLNGTAATLEADTAFANNDVGKICANGTTIKTYKNGVETNSVVDTNIADGYPGIRQGSNSTYSRFDDFVAVSP